MIQTSIEHLRRLQTETGLFKASPSLDTGYDRIWIRDNLYTSLAFEAIHDVETVEQIYHNLLNLFLKYEWKIDDVVKEKPIEDYKYIHPLYTENLKETSGGWGWKQNDSIGGFLYNVSHLQKKSYNIIRDDNDLKIIQKLVYYLASINYWVDEDNGMWEESKEIHISSVGACVAGLDAIKTFVDVPDSLIKDGRWTLRVMLPAESSTKNVDLALLSLIYPYNLTDREMALQILSNIENKLVRDKGVIRYEQDKYYMEDGIEASWTMGLPWLAICYHQLNNLTKYKYYINKTISIMNDNMELTELFIKDKSPNKNTPLGWSQALLVKALTL